MTRSLLHLAFLACVFLSAGCGSGSNKPAGPNADDPNKDTDPALPKHDLSVTAEDLAKDFETDSTAATKKYEGKMLLIEGVVKDVETGHSGMTRLLLLGFTAAGKSPGHVVRGSFAEPAGNTVQDLTPGQSVKLVGKFQDDSFNRYVDLSECQLGKPGKDPAVFVTAVDLTKAYNDEKAADGRYKDKWLVVEGKVSEVNNGEFASVILEGFDEKADKVIRVKVSYSLDRKDAAATIRRGDKVKLKGECTGLAPDRETVRLDQGRPAK